MSSNIPPGEVVGKGGFGDVSKAESVYGDPEGTNYRLDKRKRDIYKNREILTTTGAKIFREYLLKNCEFLKPLQNGKDFFSLPANSLQEDDIKNMLGVLDQLNLFAIGTEVKDLVPHVQAMVDSDEDLIRIADEGDILEGMQYPEDLVSMFRQLREFLIVEYLNSLNEPVSESIVHNLGFTVNQVKDDPHSYQVNVQLENWSGEEEVVRVRKREVDHKMKNFDNKNVYDVIKEINSTASAEERREKVNELLSSLTPIAKAIDFIRADKRVKRISSNGKTELIEVDKVPFQHFDIKPSNIFARTLINKKGQEYYSLILGDFGVSSLPGDSVSGFIFGSPAYAAPELLDPGISTDKTRTDIYSFAVTLFEVLAGRLPAIYMDVQKGYTLDTPNEFTTDTKPMQLDEHTTKDVRVSTNLVINDSDRQALLDRGIATPQNVDSIIEVLAKGMSLNPEDRFQTCTSMVEALLLEMNATNATV